MFIIPLRLAYTAYTAGTLLMKLSTAVEADSRLTEKEYYTDWSKGCTRLEQQSKNENFQQTYLLTALT